MCKDQNTSVRDWRSEENSFILCTCTYGKFQIMERNFSYTIRLSTTWYSFKEKRPKELIRVYSSVTH